MVIIQKWPIPSAASLKFFQVYDSKKGTNESIDEVFHFTDFQAGFHSGLGVGFR